MTKFKWPDSEAAYKFERKDISAFSMKAGSLDSEKRTLKAVFSTGSIDRDGEIVHPKAFEKRIKSFKDNPVVLWNHDPYSSTPIGKVIELEITDKEVSGTIQFRDKGDSPKADDVFSAYEGGFLKTFSIGFRVYETHQERDGEGKAIGPLEIVDAELMELSAVPIPANPEAMVMAKRMFTMIEGAQVGNATDHAKTLYVRPSDTDVITRAGVILKDALSKQAAGEIVDETLLKSIESLRLDVLGVAVRKEEDEEIEGALDDVLACF